MASIEIEFLHDQVQNSVTTKPGFLLDQVKKQTIRRNLDYLFGQVKQISVTTKYIF